MQVHSDKTLGSEVCPQHSGSLYYPLRNKEKEAQEALLRLRCTLGQTFPAVSLPSSGCSASLQVYLCHFLGRSNILLNMGTT